MTTPTPQPPPVPPDTTGSAARPGSWTPPALTEGSAPGGTPAATAWSGAVLVPLSAGHQPPLPVGRRIPIPLVPVQLRPTGPTPARSRTGQRGTRRRIILSGAAAVVAVVTLTAVAAVRVASGPGAGDVVREFFAALAAHDPARLPATPCQDNPLCTPDALRQGYQAPQDVAVGADTGTDTDRHVPVTYTLDGRRVTDTVDVHGTSRGMFSGRIWSMTSQPGATLVLPEQTPAPITLAAARLPSSQPGQPVTVWAPPGRYTLTRPATVLLEAVQQQLTVTTGPPITVSVGVTMKPAVTGTAGTLIRDRIDACAGQHSFTPAVGPSGQDWHSCPMSYVERYAITDDPTWTVQRYPELQLEPAPDGAVTVSTSTPGRAVIRYRWSTSVVEPRSWTDATDTVEITVTGRVAAPNGTPEWQPA